MRIPTGGLRGKARNRYPLQIGFATVLEVNVTVEATTTPGHDDETRAKCDEIGEPAHAREAAQGKKLSRAGARDVNPDKAAKREALPLVGWGETLSEN